MKNKIIVHGSYYGRNFGDTLLIKVVVDWIKENSNYEPLLYGVNSAEEADEIGARKITPKELSEVKKVVYTGGGYFGAPNNRSFLRTNYWYFRNFMRHIFWHRKLKNPTIMVAGVGYGPLNDLLFKPATKKMFSKAKAVYLRDEESLNLFLEGKQKPENIHLGVDLAYSYGINETGNVPEENLIGLHIPVADGDLSDIYFENLYPFLKDHKVEIFTDSIGMSNLINNPSSLYYKLSNKMDIKFLPYQSIDNTIENLRRYKTIITSKLHIGIISTNLKIPVYAIPYHQKTIRYYKQINYADYCNPIHGFDEKKHHLNMENILRIPRPNIPQERYNKLLEIKNAVINFVNDK